MSSSIINLQFLRGTFTHRAMRWLGVVSFMVLAVGASAQTAVTGLTYGTATDGTNSTGTITQGSTSTTVTYLNQKTPVNTVTAGSTTFHMGGPTATNVFVRRHTDYSGNGIANESGIDNQNATTLYQHYGGSDSLSPPSSVSVYGKKNSTVEQALLSNNLYTVLGETFFNATNTSNATGKNIERIDFFFAGGYQVQTGDALVFFDMEANTAAEVGDTFRIAAYTDVGAVNGSANAPTTYANSGILVDPSSSDWGAVTNPKGSKSGNYLRGRFKAGDNISGTGDSYLDIANQKLVGTVITFADLGIAAGTTIFGYSLFAADVATTVSATSLVDWRNTTIYSGDTEGDAAAFDLVAFGSQIARPVPEPTTYGMIFVGLATLGFGWRRWHQSRRAA